MTGRAGSQDPASTGPDVVETVATVVEAVAVTEVAFALTAGGMLLSVVWLATPRIIPVGVAGACVLATGILGLVRLPVGPAAVFLLVLAGASLVMEVIAAPGLVLHAAGGGLALAMGGACLHEPGTGAHLGVVVPVAAAVATGTWVAGRGSWRVAREDPFADSDRLTGRRATVLDTDADGTDGHAVVAGQVWTISGAGRPLVAGARVRVVSRDRDRLVVAPTRVPPL